MRFPIIDNACMCAQVPSPLVSLHSPSTHARARSGHLLPTSPLTTLFISFLLSLTHAFARSFRFAFLFAVCQEDIYRRSETRSKRDPPVGCFSFCFLIVCLLFCVSCFLYPPIRQVIVTSENAFRSGGRDVVTMTHRKTAALLAQSPPPQLSPCADPAPLPMLRRFS